MGTISRTTELIINQGEEFTHNVAMVDRDGTAVDPSTATNIYLRAYEFTDSATATIDITGTSDATNLIFAFNSRDTLNVTPQSYIYYVTCTIGTTDYVVVADNLSIARVIRE